MIRTLIVDDSKFMRVNLEQILTHDLEINVVGTARNGLEALEFLKDHQVDVIILDFFMPKMDGLQTLENIMKSNPIPTIMITIANQAENADLYFKAIRLGAFDIIPKPSGRESLYIDQVKEILIEKIKTAAISKNKLKKLMDQTNATERFCEESKKILIQMDRPENQLQKGNDPLLFIPPFDLLIIGASTGGPSKVTELIKLITYKHNLAILIVQHMPAGFTEFFAKQLSEVTPFKFVEPAHLEKIRPGLGYVVPGNYHLNLILNNFDIDVLLDQSERIWGVRPCIDITMKSAAPIFKKYCYGVLLTGMGEDGAQGIRAIKNFNGITYAQSPEEALISSMPDHAIKTGAVDFILPVERIAQSLNQKFK